MPLSGIKKEKLYVLELGAFGCNAGWLTSFVVVEAISKKDAELKAEEYIAQGYKLDKVSKFKLNTKY